MYLCSLAHSGCNTGILVKSVGDSNDCHIRLSMDVNRHRRIILVLNGIEEE